MPYSKFSLKSAKEEFHLTLIEREDLFSHVEPTPIPAALRETLLENVPLALAINTEKARSELIIAPILVALRKMLDYRIGLFSGIGFDVDVEQQLNGVCDFLISRSPEQLFLTAPVIAIVEAKNEDIISGMGQCVAEMIAAQRFNQREETEIAEIYGAVTSGNVWKFLKLSQSDVFIDVREYYLERIEKIMGILIAMIQQQA